MSDLTWFVEFGILLVVVQLIFSVFRRVLTWM